MFEKEAYDYSIDTYETCLYDDLPYANDSRAREESFRDGAEFGYNKAVNELKCCANCNNSYGGEEEPYHDCGYCHAMQCICKLKLEEHTSDIYRMWEDKCERWEMRVN